MTDIADRLNDLPLRDHSKPDTEQGLFQKFIVTRTDGSSGPGGKHEGCEYFVLDIDHDPLHKPALEAYANACESTHPQLADDLRTRYRLRVPIGKPEPQGPPIYSVGERVLRRRAHAFGIARDIADAFAQQENEGTTGAALFRALANKLLSEPVLVNAIADWRQAAMDAVDRVEQAPAATPRSSSHAETARKLLARNDALAVHCTLSAHYEQWWRLHREFEEQQREILQVMTDGLRARETPAGRPPTAGMNLSQSKPVHASAVIVETTAMWAGAQTAKEDGAVHFSREAWEKFVACLGEDPPLEVLTSPGCSAPVDQVHQRCSARGCQEALPCPGGRCALHQGERA